MGLATTLRGRYKAPMRALSRLLLPTRLAALAALAALLTVACEDPAAAPDAADDASDAADSADAADVAAPPPANPLFDPAGEIALVEQVSEGTPVQAEVSARLYSAPQPNLQRFVAEVGDCQLWVRPPALCDPPCNAFTEACVPGPACVALPEGRSAGAITITGTTPSLALTYAGQGQYFANADPPADVFAKGASLAITAAGGELAAFTATLTGVGDLADTFGAVALVDGASTTVNWTPAGDGSRIELVLQLGWHANPPEAVIFCQAPDSAGAIVIASEIVKDFPYFEGMGLFQVPSWVQRVSRATVASAAGPIAIYAASRQAVSVTHSP